MNVRLMCEQLLVPVAGLKLKKRFGVEIKGRSNMRKQKLVKRRNRNRWLLGIGLLIAVGGVTTFFLVYDNGATTKKAGVTTSSLTQSSSKDVRKPSQKTSSDESSTASSEAAMSYDDSPALHLTSQQFENWVRIILKQGSQVYTPQNYRFDPVMNNGLAELKVYYNTSPDVQYGITNKFDSSKESTAQGGPTDFEYNGTYRINQRGQLEYRSSVETGYQLVSDADDALQTVISEK